MIVYRVETTGSHFMSVYCWGSGVFLWGIHLMKNKALKEAVINNLYV